MTVGRQTWVLAHRWAGLSIALFLIVVGTTGSLLPWQDELTWLTARPLSDARPPTAEARPLDPLELAARVARQTGATITGLEFDSDPHPAHVAVLFAAAPAGAPYDTIWADPYTGRVVTAFRYGMLADGRQALMGFLYRVHYSLALGAVGQYVLGIAALIWTLDCFVGLYLTFPVRRRSGAPAPARGWWHRWRPAWAIRWGASSHKLTFDLHRAGGLWIWPMLFVFAWSSVAFNLREVSVPVMRLFGGSDFYYPPPLAKPPGAAPIGLPAAVARGRALLAEIGRREGFAVGRSVGLRYMPERGAYRYAAAAGSRVINEGGQRGVYFSAIDGRFMGYDPPIARGPANAFMDWLDKLHTAGVFGLPYKALVSAIGLLTVVLSVTGVLIWTKRRSAQLLGRRRRQVALAFDPRLQPAE